MKIVSFLYLLNRKPINVIRTPDVWTFQVDLNASAKKDILETELILVKILTSAKLVIINVCSTPSVLITLDRTAANAKRDTQEMQGKNA